MKRNITGLLLAGVLCLALSSPTPYAQDTTKWEKSNAAGMKAYEEGRYAEAEKRWLAALEEAENFGPDDERLATSLNNLAGLYDNQGKHAEAEPLYQRALAIVEKALAPEHPDLATSLENYARLLRKIDRDAEAKKLESRAQAIRARHAGENP